MPPPRTRSSLTEKTFSPGRSFSVHSLSSSRSISIEWNWIHVSPSSQRISPFSCNLPRTSLPLMVVMTVPSARTITFTGSEPSQLIMPALIRQMGLPMLPDGVHAVASNFANCSRDAMGTHVSCPPSHWISPLACDSPEASLPLTVVKTRPSANAVNLAGSTPCSSSMPPTTEKMRLPRCFFSVHALSSNFFNLSSAEAKATQAPSPLPYSMSPFSCNFPTSSFPSKVATSSLSPVNFTGPGVKPSPSSRPPLTTKMRLPGSFSSVHEWPSRLATFSDDAIGIQTPSSPSHSMWPSSVSLPTAGRPSKLVKTVPSSRTVSFAGISPSPSTWPSAMVKICLPGWSF
mmetsp:Transcript_124003/g.355973  ORF Transcript_124003/g.355973 Transcript_124003/m.355973 type:complete len:345 (+) Transcript_124003:2532-3566(+)